MKFSKKRIMALICAVLLIVLCVSGGAAEKTGADAKIKNIIYMIPDGGGMAPFYMADAVKEAGGFVEGLYPNATPVTKDTMYAEKYLVGSETTYSANSSVTDSAAGGTALSTGKKTNNGYIGINPDAVPVANILEAAQSVGKRTGMVSTYAWTNATPASFSAHDISRSNETNMSEQIVSQGIDVVFGTTISAFSGASWFADSYLESNGYDIIKKRTALANVKKGDRVWGKFPGILYYDITKAATIPTLEEMTSAAIKALADADEDGFFLMVEGSAVDGGGHANHPVNMVSEFLAFDKACEVAFKFAEGRDDTIVMIMPDHDTGGMNFNSANLSTIVTDIRNGKTASTGLSWDGTGHTAREGGVFIYAPEGVSLPEGMDRARVATVATEFKNSNYKTSASNRVDNTDLPKYVAGFMGVDLDELSDKLFVDVTNMGIYDSASGTFSFAAYDVSVRKNQSVAYVDGKKFDMDGEIALYINNKFYVPEKLVEKGLGGSAAVGRVDVTSMGTYQNGVFKFNNVDVALKNGVTEFVYKGKTISMNGSTAVYLDGKFYVPQKLLQAIERFESNEAGDISVIADYNTKKIKVSGWIPTDNTEIGMVVMEPEKTIDDLENGNIVAIGQVRGDYNGDFEYEFAVDSVLSGNYMFNMNYTTSEKDPVTKSFDFRNTIPQMLVTNASGEEIMYMMQLGAGDEVCVTLRGFDLEDAFTGSLIIAQYDKNDVLIGAQSFDGNGDSVIPGTEVEGNAYVMSGAEKIKVMFWDKKNNIPVMGSFIIK